MGNKTKSEVHTMEGHEELEANLSMELFRQELSRVHHLNWLALATFAFLGTLALALLVFHEAVSLPWWPLSVAALVATALAMAGAHSLVGNAGDYWISFAVASHAIRGSGLTRRGIFPSSLMAYPPYTLRQFVLRLLFGSRGALLVLYMVLGGLGGFSALHHYVVMWAALVLGGITPVFFTALSAWVSFNRLRHLLWALVQEAQLWGGSTEELAERHCSVAETLVLFHPPKIAEAISHYELAIELQPENTRAVEGLQRLR